MILIDTSVIYALLDRADARHALTADWYECSHPQVATTPLVLAEVDHLAVTRGGPQAVTAWREDLTAGSDGRRAHAPRPRCADCVQVGPARPRAGAPLARPTLAR